MQTKKSEKGKHLASVSSVATVQSPTTGERNDDDLKRLQIVTPKTKQALPGSRMNAWAMPPEALTIAGIDTKDDESFHLTDGASNKTQICEDLVRNIMVYGVIEPVIVTKRSDRIYVVDGRGRVRAAREANIRLEREGKEPLCVPCMTKSGEDHRIFGFSTSANGFRREMAVIDKARKVSFFLDMGRSEEEACVTFGVSDQTIVNYRNLLTLEPEVQSAIESGGITATDALARFLGQPRAKQIAMLAKPRERTPRGRPCAPGRATLQLVVEHRPESVSEDFIRGIQFALGDLKAEDLGINIDALKNKDKAPPESAEKKTRTKKAK